MKAENENWLRAKIRAKGHVPYVEEPGGFVITCPHCMRNISTSVEDLGVEITHDSSRCRSWRKKCDGKFTVDSDMRGLSIPSGRRVGTEEYENGG